MPDTIEYAISATVVMLVLLVNIAATRLIVRDEDCERHQNILQAAVVWLIPLIGAIFVFAIHRSEEKSSGKYREPLDAGDEYRDTARNASNRARMDADSHE